LQPGNKLKFMSRSQIDRISDAGDLDVYRRKLTAILARLGSAYCDVTLARDSESPAGDSVDHQDLDCDSNSMLSRLEWMSLLTRQVAAALGRIDNGAYGLCQRCVQPIGVKRLDAIPWVAFCMRCQEEQAGIRVM
jgi:DnaK suppressor protein